MSESRIGFEPPWTGVAQTPHLPRLRAHFSVPLRTFGPGAKAGLRRHIITPAGRFPLGFSGAVFRKLTELGETPAISPEMNFVLSKNFSGLEPGELKFPLRDYQVSAVKKAFAHGRGILRMATGAGKTAVMASMAKGLLETDPEARVLVLVPDISLCAQTSSDFVNYGIPEEWVCRWSGGYDLDPSRKIVVCNHDILLARPEEREALLSRQFLFLDELHTLGSGNQITKILKKFKAAHRWGFTGTLPLDNFELWTALGLCGDVLTEVGADELIQQGWLANIKIFTVELHYKEKPKYSRLKENPSENFRIETEWILNHSFRNSAIVAVVRKFPGNFLILVNRIAHGEAIIEKLREKVPEKTVVFIQGETDLDERGKTVMMMERESGVVLVAISSIFATGINIKNLPNIIFADPGKSKTRILQGIGRGLRLHEAKEVLRVFDFSDMLRYGGKHLSERIKFYESEKFSHKTLELREE